MKEIKPGDCVKLPDGRIGRVREKKRGKLKVRVKRKTSDTKHIMEFTLEEVKRTECPEGWMSPEGYQRYLKKTLAKMKEREQNKK